MNSQNAGSAVRLALAILLLWLAGLSFFVAFEGAKFLPEQSGPGGPFVGILRELMRRTQSKENPG